MRKGSWCEINKQGEILHLDWEYIELRAAMHRKRFEDNPSKILIAWDENTEGLIACLALAIREQVLHSKIPDGTKK